MIKLCLSGARGRMGRVLLDLTQAAQDIDLASMLERADHPEIGMELIPSVELAYQARSAIAKSDVVLDFSLADTVLDHLSLAAELGKPFVTGTTGFSDQHIRVFEERAKDIPIVLASNMSRGVHLLNQLVGTAAGALRDYDAEILEIHHKNKVDAPSGTALKLADAIRSHGLRDKSVYARKGLREPDEVGIAAIRGGDVVGEHQVMFMAAGEQLILTHRATSREHFARGALDAVRFIVGQQPGMYGMDEVFKKTD